MKDFPSALASDDLIQMFSKFGPLVSVKLIPPSNRELPIASDHESFGFGFVCFRHPEHAQEAQRAMNGVNGLYVAFHRNKELRHRDIVSARLNS